MNAIIALAVTANRLAVGPTKVKREPVSSRLQRRNADGAPRGLPFRRWRRC